MNLHGLFLFITDCLFKLGYLELYLYKKNTASSIRYIYASLYLGAMQLTYPMHLCSYNSKEVLLATLMGIHLRNTYKLLNYLEVLGYE